jgi:hypothetical protein
VPRFGPEKIVCGHCHAEINTGLKPWASLTKEQKVWKGFWELFAPSYFGTYSSIAGLIVLFGNIALVLCPLVAIIEFAMIPASGGKPDPSTIGTAVAIFLVGILYVWYYPLKHLRNEIDVSNAYSESNKAPVWFVGATRDWLKIALYATAGLIVFFIVLTVILVGGGV